MPSPFPGMDPFLERREIWPDFHDSLITYLRETLQPLLRPQYVALTQDRLFVVESDRPIRPDVSIIETKPSESPVGEPVGRQASIATTVVEIYREEFRQPYIEIIEPASGNRVITAIEILSPDNKSAGAGLNSYVRKQQELWDAGANLVEIDLLSTGTRFSRVERARVIHELDRRYLITVTRQYPTRCELYGVDLPQPLPKISIPLQAVDRDVIIDLQAIFNRCYDSGPYPQLLYYHQACPSKLSEAENSFVSKILKSR